MFTYIHLNEVWIVARCGHYQLKAKENVHISNTSLAIYSCLMVADPGNHQFCETQ